MLKLHHLGIIICIALSQQSFAYDDPEIKKIMQGIQSSFAFPYQDLFIKEHESEWRNLLDGLSMSLSTNYPLTQKVNDNSGSGAQGSRRTSATTSSVAFKYNPVGYWFASIAFTKYWREDLQRPWNPDFSYVFGYSDWHPYTFSLTYANYGGNRLNPDKDAGERHTNFKQGAWSLGWKFPLPKSLTRPFTFNEKDSMGCGLSYNVVPEFLDLASLSNKKNKRTVGLNCRYNMQNWWYFSVNFKHYLDPDQQQPWDPDYTYGFGYFDWHPGTISIQYNNYSANKFSSSDRPANSGLFKHGGISISWSHVW